MSSDLIIQTLYLFLLGLIFAALETQIEGESGWAAKLPTWRPSDSNWFFKIYRKVLFGKDVTAYHLLIFTLLLVILHQPYFMGRGWTLGQELTTLSFFFLLSVIWDFLWFILNPHYDFADFGAKRVWWHKKWFLHLPVDYWFGLIISVLLYTRFSLNWMLFKEWLEIITLFFIFIVATIIFAIVAGIFRGRQNTNK